MAVAAQRRVTVGEVPVIDISPLGGDPAAEALVVAEMRRACAATGFFYIAHHGIAPATVAEVFRQSRRFFALPLAARQALSLTRSPLYRGYLPIGARGENRERPPDLLESFNIGRELGPDDPAVRAGTPLHGANPWPDGLPGFREAMLDYFAQLDALARRLLGGFALALGLPRDGLDTRHRRPVSSIRLLHYPPEPDPGFEMLGARPHRDTGIFTILLQDDNSGLEAADAAGEWMVVPPIPGTFVVNVADMMSALSNGRFVSALHRVINCYGEDRYSIPFFVTPDYDAMIEPLPHLVDRDHPAACASYQSGTELLALFRGLWPGAGQVDSAA
jgi:isopenicillin N synthase-like dioxygenase